MVEKIEVGYTSTPAGNGVPVYHKYILYTDSNGNQFYTRGGPGYFGPGAAQGGRDEYSNSSLGNIKTEEGEYVKGTPDYDKGSTSKPEGDLPDPRELIIQGNDLSDSWKKIVQGMKNIDNENNPYGPTQNSNTAVDDALRQAGLPEPTQDGFDKHWAPGSGNKLSGGINDPINPNLPKENFPVPGDAGLFFPHGLPIPSIRDNFNSAKNTISPLILDLNGDGVTTLGLNAKIHFDHDNNEFAELSGWADSNDGLLVLDKNADGKITSGAELFGNNTVLVNGQKADNGFSALAELDTNKDGKVDALDTAFNNLRVWKDVDSDGITDAGELITLNSAGVKSINLNYSTDTIVDAQGNAHQQIGTYTNTNNQTRAVEDIWFAADLAYTRETTLVAVSEEIAALPNAAGFGNVHSLHQAMARKAKLNLNFGMAA